MNELLSKLSSYNILNYLVPGAVFSILAERMSLIKSPDLIAEQLVWFYFMGMVISRLGSIIVEPILKSIGFVNYSDYGDYLAACRIDQKIEIMVEASNTYRTIATVFLSLLICTLFMSASEWFEIDERLRGNIAIALLFALFLLSFRKQVNFITGRVNHCNKETE